MGTSVNQRSPNTPNWNIVQRAYESQSVTLERALQEIWRAAANDASGNLVGQLSNPALAEVGDLAASRQSPADVSDAVATYLVETKSSTLATDIARRAAMQVAAQPGSNSTFFARVIAEATNYLVSRDLPGHVTPGHRLANVSEARAFRNQLVSAAEAFARRRESQATNATWSDLVATTIDKIRFGGDE